MYQEVCLDDKNIGGMKAYFTTKGWDSVISNTCADNSKPTAGVATTLWHHGHAKQTHAHTEEYKAALLTGRIGISCCNLGGAEAIYIVNCYGWTNGENCTEAANKTNQLIRAACSEFK